MKVKKYIAPTMPEAMQQIRKELGSNAVILNSKEVSKGGFFGILKKKHIEVVAALDPSPLASKARDSAQQHVSVHKGADGNDRQSDVLSEIKQLKQMFLSTNQSNGHYPPAYQIMFHYLRDQDVSPEICTSLIETVLSEHPDETDERIVYRYVKQALTEQLQQHSFGQMYFDKKVIHFVGPTGVGKTTTLAKIAAKAMIGHNKKVAFITVDTYRIAAIDQLKTYARILNVPIEVAYDIEQYRHAVERFKDYDLIFVDTAGRNFQSERYVKELTNSIDFNDNIDTFLVLSMTAKSQDMLNVHDQFNHLPIKGLIFTKVDETRQYGGLLNMTLSNNRSSIAYMTNGQDVPDDLIEPTPEYLAGLIMEGFHNG
ncbi:flagellar biosynthesis protein FlhF [Lentibacillus saliphilus]|uniref:flagellar biosynthesis protein FlhF n=1 Tax=Lentibacillus saliphilus TaxID=2737028 RepID=UPI001C3001C0|nr:flagellar biosynthesis protein FlhF [Lentibacillus saliphilus]